MHKDIRHSLCFHVPPAGKRRAFHKCSTPSRCFVDDELNAVASAMPYGRRHDFIQYVAAIACAGARGELDMDDDRDVPVQSQPDLWELRYPYPQSFDSRVPRQEFRMYYAQDEERNPEMVALLFHRKETEGLTPQQQKVLQNEIMGEAQERYTRYEDIRWGHIPQHCTHCFTLALVKGRS